MMNDIWMPIPPTVRASKFADEDSAMDIYNFLMGLYPQQVMLHRRIDDREIELIRWFDGNDMSSIGLGCYLVDNGTDILVVLADEFEQRYALHHEPIESPQEENQEDVQAEVPGMPDDLGEVPPLP